MPVDNPDFSKQNISVSIPPLNLFMSDNDTERTVQEKCDWWKERQKTPWIFKQELESYCVDDTLILLKLCLSFMKEWTALESNMAEFFNKEKSLTFFPFNEPFCTLG